MCAIPKSAALILTLILTLCSIALFIVGAVGYSNNQNSLQDTAWGRFTSPQYPWQPPNNQGTVFLNVDVYVGLTAFLVKATINGENYFQTRDFNGGSCSDAGKGVLALLVICLAFLAFISIGNLIRIYQDSYSTKVICIFLSAYVVIVSICAFGSWIQMCYNAQVSLCNDTECKQVHKYENQKFYVGFACTVTGFCLMVIVTLLHGIIASDEVKDLTNIQTVNTKEQPDAAVP